MARTDVPRRRDYARFHAVTSRWLDNDVYGHVNNATYFAYFDSAINHHLIARGGLDPAGGTVVGWVVSSRCDFFRPLRYPDAGEIGLRADRIGRSSATYGVAAFRAGDDEARAAGAMTHVFVDRATSRPVPIPAALRRALEEIAHARPGSGTP